MTVNYRRATIDYMKRGRPGRLSKLERKLAEQAIRDIDKYFAETGGESVSMRDVRPRFVLIKGGKR